MGWIHTALMLVAILIAIGNVSADLSPGGGGGPPISQSPLGDYLGQLEYETDVIEVDPADPENDEVFIRATIGASTCGIDADGDNNDCDYNEMLCGSTGSIICTTDCNIDNSCELKWVNAQRIAGTNGYVADDELCVKTDSDLALARSSTECGGGGGTSPGEPDTCSSPCEPTGEVYQIGAPYCTPAGTERILYCSADGCQYSEPTGNTCTLGGTCGDCEPDDDPFGETTYRTTSNQCDTGFRPRCNVDDQTCTCVI